MRIYKVGKTWIDLDHILLIGQLEEKKLEVNENIYGYFSFCDIQFMFVETVKELNIINSYQDFNLYILSNEIVEELKTIGEQRYNKLLQAWKNK